MKKSKARTLLNEGFEHHNNGRYNESINSYTKNMKFSQNNMWAYGNRGLAYLHKGEYDEAIGDYTKSIKGYTKIIKEAIRVMNLSLNRREHDDKSMDNIKKDFTHTYNNRGNAYLKKGENDLAILDYNKAIEINPNYSKVQERIERIRESK